MINSCVRKTSIEGKEGICRMRMGRINTVIEDEVVKVVLEGELDPVNEGEIKSTLAEIPDGHDVEFVMSEVDLILACVLGPIVYWGAKAARSGRRVTFRANTLSARLLRLFQVPEHLIVQAESAA